MSLINRIRDRAAAADSKKGIDPYEPITEEDEGIGWGGALIVILMGLATVAHVLHFGKE